MATDLRGDGPGARGLDGGTTAVRRNGAAARACRSPRLRLPRRRRGTSTSLLGGVAAAMALVKAFRMHGHLAARLDPLGSEPMGDPALDETRLVPALTPELQARIPAALLRLYVPGDTLLEALPRLREVYMRVDRVRDRAHLRPRRARLAAEGDRVRALPRPLDPERARAAPARLSQVEGFEQYLRASFLGQKQFSLEGLDVLIPMLDEAIELAAADGAHEVVIGMAHRGRLNALVAHGRAPVRVDPARVRGRARRSTRSSSTPRAGRGDVKYHLPALGHARDARPARSR